MDYYQAHHHLYINNVMGAFVRGIADWFKDEWFNRSEEVIVSTFSKAVAHWIKKKELSGENFAWEHPMVSFDFSLDFEPDPQAGRFFHGYPHYSTKFATKLWKPDIYVDDELQITPGWNRYTGRMEMNIMCSTVYDYIDYRFMVFQLWGGLERIIHPENIEGYIIIPDDIVSYAYQNNWTGEVKTIDWSENQADVYLVRNINQNKMCFPFVVRPYLQLTGVSDGSDKYGGSGEEIAEYKLSVEFKWECYIPTHITLINKTYPEKCPDCWTNINMIVSMHHVPIRTEDTLEEDVVTVAIPDEHFVLPADCTSGVCKMVAYEFDKSHNYILTQDDIDILHNEEHENSILNITLIDPVPNADCNRIILSCKYGVIKRDYAWNLIDEYTVKLFGFMLGELDTGDIINVAYYKEK